MRAILTFHSIDDKNSVISYTPKAFGKLIDSLKTKNIPILDLATLVDPATKNGIAITFDDGMQSVYENALPILTNYNACAHIYVTTSAVGSNQPWPRQAADGITYQMLSWNEIEELKKNNIHIENHTHTHPDFRKLSLQQMQDECEQSDNIIESYTGERPEHFAYPFGYHNSVAREFVKSRYKTAVTTELKVLSNIDELSAVPRLDSYYLQSDWAINHIDSVLMQGYLAMRNMLRNIKGSQNKATYD